MKLLPDWIKNGYLRLIDPVANWLVKRGVHPNTITVVGTLCTVVGGGIYARGHTPAGGPSAPPSAGSSPRRDTSGGVASSPAPPPCSTCWTGRCPAGPTRARP